MAPSIVYAVYRDTLDAMAGRPVTDEEVERFKDALGNSTVSEVVENVLYAVIGSGMDELI